MGNDIFATLLASALGLIFYFYITSLVHNIRTRTNLQRAQLFILQKMAEKQGVSEEDLAATNQVRKGQYDVSKDGKIVPLKPWPSK
jgi:hypothetical protein